MISGGIDFSLFGMRVRSHRWSDPAMVAVVSLLVFAWLRRRSKTPPVRSTRASVAAEVRWLYLGYFEQTDFTYPPLFILVVAGTLWFAFRAYHLTTTLRYGLAARGESLASHRDGRGAPRARRDDREYRLYLREEQRRPRGCIARRMQPDFYHGLLRTARERPPDWQ